MDSSQFIDFQKARKLFSKEQTVRNFILLKYATEQLEIRNFESNFLEKERQKVANEISSL